MKLAELILERFWLKKVSIIVAIAIEAIAIILLFPDDISQISFKFWIVIATSSVVCFTYIILTIKSNTLPKVPTNSTGVLFVITAENKKTFQHAEFCLARKFEELSKVYGIQKFKVVCLENDRVKKYDLSEKSDAIKLLNKVNCLFCVQTTCTVDDVNNAENYEMRINFGFIHQVLAPKSDELLKQEMRLFTNNLVLQNFSRNNSIQVFSTTAESLTYICAYFLGVTVFIGKDFSSAQNIFHKIKGQLHTKEISRKLKDVLSPIISKRIFECYSNLALLEEKYFKDSRDKEHLVKYKHFLELANEENPNTYTYFLNNAWLEIMLNRDPKKSSEFIDKCRNFIGESSWRYSDAFLSAFEDENPLKTYRKYKAAFKYDYNLVSIIEFIEFILEEDFWRKSLHLPLILLYCEIHDYQLMRKNIMAYRKWISDKYVGKGIIEIIDKLEQEFPCPINKKCDDDCEKCELTTSDIIRQTI